MNQYNVDEKAIYIVAYVKESEIVTYFELMLTRVYGGDIPCSYDCKGI